MCLSILPTQLFTGVWVHDGRLSKQHQQSMKLRLDETFHHVHVFDNIQDFSSYMKKDRLVSKIILIVSHAELCIPLIQLSLTTELCQNVYVFLTSPLPLENSILSFTNLVDLFERIHNNLRILNESETITPEEQNDSRSSTESAFRYASKPRIPIRHLHKDSEKSFMLLTALRILISISHDPTALKEMLRECRAIYETNQRELDHIDELDNYRADNVIEYYTKATFLFYIVNQTLRTEDINEIFRFRVYITDLHNKLVQLHRNREADIGEGWKKLMRGKRLTPTALQQLIDNQKGFITMNGFLSTTHDEAVARVFAGDAQVDGDHRRVIFELHINNSMEIPHSDIQSSSPMGSECERLFSVGTIWQVTEVKFEDSVWRVYLQTCKEFDEILKENFRKFTRDGCNIIALGDIVQALGDDIGAEWFYRKMLEDGPVTNDVQIIVRYKIAMLKKAKSDYDASLKQLNTILTLLSLPENEPTESTRPKPHYMHSNQSYRLTIHQNRGYMFQKKEKFDKALECYNQALQQTGSEAEYAAIHSDMGLLLFLDGKYDEAYGHHAIGMKMIGDNHEKSATYRKNLNLTQRRCEHLKNNPKREQNIQKSG